MDSIIVRYGEIWLKGQNRPLFENKLVRNIKEFLKKNNIEAKVKKFRGRVLINYNKKLPNLKNIFGITSYSYAKELDLDIEIIKKQAIKLITKNTKSFRVSSKRVQKDIDINSQQINETIGEYIFEKLKTKVNLKQPEKNITIEIFNKKAYLFENNKQTVKAYGGLPVGVSGLTTLILENKDSLLAGVLMLKRGCSLELINKNKINHKTLENYSYGLNIKETKTSTENSYAIVLSETLKNYKERKFKKIILRPLISYSEKDIKNQIKYFSI